MPLVLAMRMIHLFIFIVHNFYFLKFQVVVFIIFSTADSCFGMLVLISTVRKTKDSLKNERIAAVYKISCRLETIWL